MQSEILKQSECNQRKVCKRTAINWKAKPFCGPGVILITEHLFILSRAKVYYCIQDSEIWPLIISNFQRIYDRLITFRVYLAKKCNKFIGRVCLIKFMPILLCLYSSSTGKFQEHSVTSTCVPSESTGSLWCLYNICYFLNAYVCAFSGSCKQYQLHASSK